MRFRESGPDKIGEQLFWIDKDANILEVNRLSCSKLGYSHEDLCSLTIANIDLSFERDKRPEHWRELWLPTKTQLIIYCKRPMLHFFKLKKLDANRFPLIYHK